MFTITDQGLASRILSAVALAASKDETRPHLNSVLFRVCDNILDVVATNGHVLAHYSGKLIEASPNCEVLIPLDVVEKIAKASKKAMEVQIDPDALTARVLPDGTQFTWNKVGSTFPPFEQVIPKAGATGEKTDGFAIATEYLIFAGKVFATLATQKRTAGVHLETPDHPLSPIVLSSASVPNLVVVVMPNREDRGPSRRVEKPIKKAA